MTMGISFAISLIFEVPFAALEKVMFANLHKDKSYPRESKYTKYADAMPPPGNAASTRF